MKSLFVLALAAITAAAVFLVPAAFTPAWPQSPPAAEGQTSPAPGEPTSAATGEPSPAAGGALLRRPGGRLEPLDLMPAESLIIWKGLPDPELLPPSAGADGLLLGLTRTLFSGQIPPGVRFTMRLFEGFSEVIRHPFALALLDAAAENPDGRGDVQGSDFKIVIAVEAGEAADKLLKVISSAIRELTDASVATLTAKEAHGLRYQELDDQRLKWCKIAWGRIDNLFVVSFGREVWPVAAAIAAGKHAGASQDEWVHTLRARRAQRPALIEILVDANRIRERLDPLVNGRATSFFAAWNSQDLDRALWSIGFEQRALYCEAYFDSGGKTTYRLYADAEARDPRYVGIVPPETRYAIFDVPPGEMLARLVGAIYSTRHPVHRRQLDEWWANFQREHGFDAERDILANLGDKLLMHNFPPHPLKVPLAVTIAVEIRSEPEKTRRNLNVLCEQWQQALETLAETTNVPNPLRLERQDNGIWYLSFGDFFKATAWIVTDRYFIASWSPWALEQYLAAAGPKLTGP